MTNQESELGTLEWVDNLQDGWKHEAHDFTPWLTRNLDRLSGVLGIELDLEGSEMYVGPYRADIVAIDPTDNRRVLIENQLADADLQHLGQVLAYLAGLEAKVVVWIAKAFNDAQLSAVRWLNAHTHDEFSFFAVRVRLARIGNSPLAPVFEVQEGPNNWDQTVKNTAQGKLSEIGQFCREFWAHFDERFPGVVRLGFAGTNCYTYVDDADLRISLFVSKEGVGAYLTGKHNETQESALPRIKPFLELLREATKGEYWLDDKWGNSLLEIDTRDHANWDQMAKWLHGRLQTYENALSEGP